METSLKTLLYTASERLVVQLSHKECLRTLSVRIWLAVHSKLSWYNGSASDYGSDVYIGSSPIESTRLGLDVGLIEIIIKGCLKRLRK